MQSEFITKNAKQTQKLGQILAKEAVKNKRRQKALVIGLEGELGAGKTTFVQGLARELGIKEKITSPTFVLMRSFLIGKTAGQIFKFLIHLDAYRLADHRDLLGLGIKEILTDKNNLVIIEWADRVAKVMPVGCFLVHFDHVNKNTRKINIRRSSS